MEEIKEQIAEKLESIRQELEDIDKQMSILAKGHINILYRKNKGYYYLTYREGKKIHNDYLGPVGKADLSDIMNQLSTREKLKNNRKKLIEEEKILKRSLGRRRNVPKD